MEKYAYHVNDTSIEALDRLQDAMLKANAQPWRGSPAGGCQLLDMRVNLSHQVPLAKVIIGVDLPARVPAAAKVDFDHLPIGELVDEDSDFEDGWHDDGQ